ncbi:Sds3-like-domain-containing protein [Syncephalastrum racemosum]|uniref:Sds3-like-domain-containing protein n=1 Tax=Syncephalastrum racemosum TaxID=13706 RepID=A0A1X2HDG9_SYNRA|nr:Sds3-like-domain-containing protein [Syncephalastrum racemosum]
MAEPRSPTSLSSAPPDLDETLKRKRLTPPSPPDPKSRSSPIMTPPKKRSRDDQDGNVDDNDDGNPPRRRRSSGNSNSKPDNAHQRRHREAMDALTKIEIEFARLRDKMYWEKMGDLNHEAQMIADGSHPELVVLMKEIEAKKARRIKMAEAWRESQRTNLHNHYDGMEYQANITFLSRKLELRKSILASLNNQRWKIEGELQKLNDPEACKLFPDPATLASQKQAQQREADTLQSIHHVRGFCIAPHPTTLSPDLSNDDVAFLRQSDQYVRIRQARHQQEREVSQDDADAFSSR